MGGVPRGVRVAGWAGDCVAAHGAGDVHCNLEQHESQRPAQGAGEHSVTRQGIFRPRCAPAALSACVRPSARCSSAAAASLRVDAEVLPGRAWPVARARALDS
jgi:hypothetical protein